MRASGFNSLRADTSNYRLTLLRILAGLSLTGRTILARLPLRQILTVGLRVLSRSRLTGHRLSWITLRRILPGRRLLGVRLPLRWILPLWILAGLTVSRLPLRGITLRILAGLRLHRVVARWDVALQFAHLLLQNLRGLAQRARDIRQFRRPKNNNDERSLHILIKD